MMLVSFGGERLLYGSIAFAGLVALGTTVFIEPVILVWTPLAVTLIPLAARTPTQAVRLRALAAALVAGLAILGSASVGYYFIPAIILMVFSSDRVRTATTT